MQHRVNRRRAGMLVALAATVSLGVSACGSSGTTATKDTGAQREGAALSAEKVDSIAAMVPKGALGTDGTLTVTMSTSSPPSHFEDGGGMKGADVDVANMLGDVLGLETKVVGVPLDQILPGLQAKRYDAVISQFSATPERAKVLDFVDYAQYSTALGVPTDNPKKLATDNLCGFKIGTQKGSAQAVDIIPKLSKTCEDAGKKPLQLQTYPESTATLLALQSGRLDGVLLDSPVLGYATTQSAKGKVEVVGTMDEAPVVIGVPKGSGMDKPIQAALQELDKQGLLEKAWKQWGMNDSAIHEFKITAN